MKEFFEFFGFQITKSLIFCTHAGAKKIVSDYFFFATVFLEKNLNFFLRFFRQNYVFLLPLAYMNRLYTETVQEFLIFLANYLFF